MANRALVVAASAAAFLATTVHAQNVVVNPDFGGSVADWTPGTGAFDAADCCSDAVPGSVRQDITTNGTKTLFTQCVAYDQSLNPEFGMGARIQVNAFTAGSAGSAFASVSIQFFTGASCGGATTGAAFTAGPIGITGTSAWTLYAATGQATPAGAASASVSLVGHPENGGSRRLDVSFDHVFLGPGLTTPVTLERFSVE